MNFRRLTTAFAFLAMYSSTVLASDNPVDGSATVSCSGELDWELTEGSFDVPRIVWKKDISLDLPKWYSKDVKTKIKYMRCSKAYKYGIPYPRCAKAERWISTKVPEIVWGRTEIRYPEFYKETIDFSFHTLKVYVGSCSGDIDVEYDEENPELKEFASKDENRDIIRSNASALLEQNTALVKRQTEAVQALSEYSQNYKKFKDVVSTSISSIEAVDPQKAQELKDKLRDERIRYEVQRQLITDIVLDLNEQSNKIGKLREDMLSEIYPEIYGK